MSDRWSRLAPLTGVLFAVVALVAFFTGGEETPKAGASAASVVSFYTTHHSEIERGDILFAIAFLVLVLFAGALRSYLRRTSAAEGLGALVLAGGILMAAAAIGVSGLEYGLAHHIHEVSPETAKTLNFVSTELFLPLLAGAFLLGVCSGLAILRGAALPNWLGVVAIILGILALVPPVDFASLLGFVVWSFVVSILMYLRLGKSADPASVAASQQPTPQPAI